MSEEEDVRGEGILQPIFVALTAYLNFIKAMGDAAQKLNIVPEDMEAFKAEMMQNQAPAYPLPRIIYPRCHGRTRVNTAIQTQLLFGATATEVIHREACKEKEHPLDQKYPHLCVNQECFSDEKKEVRKRIRYEHALDKYYEGDNLFVNMHMDFNYRRATVIRMLEFAKKRHEARKQFKIWWRNPIIGFLCCDCFEEWSEVGE